MQMDRIKRITSEGADFYDIRKQVNSSVLRQIVIEDRILI